MSKKVSNTNNKEGFSKVSLNWLITIYPRIRESLGKIRDCDI